MNIFGLFSSLSFPLLLLSCEIQCKSEKSRRNKRRRMDSPRRFLDAHDPVDGGKLEPSFHCESIVGACGVAGSRKERQNKELSAELFPAENLYRSSPSVCQLSRLASLLAGYKFSFTAGLLVLWLITSLTFYAPQRRSARGFLGKFSAALACRYWAFSRSRDCCPATCYNLVRHAFLEGVSGDCAIFLCILACSTNWRCHRCVENSQIK